MTPPNGLGILLARASSTQAQDLKHNVSAGLPVLKRAPSSAVYRSTPVLRPLHAGYPRSSNSLLDGHDTVHGGGHAARYGECSTCGSVT